MRLEKGISALVKRTPKSSLAPLPCGHINRRLCIVCNQEEGPFQDPIVLDPQSQNSKPQNREE